MRPTVRALTLADTGTALLLYDALTLGPKTSDAGHFGRVISHPGTTVFGAFAGSALVGMATLHLLPNVTWGGRPYGLVENVVTHPDHRNQGVGRAVIDAIRDAAQSAHAYKLMLLTGRKRSAKGFYEAVGFSEEDKYGMVMRWS